MSKNDRPVTCESCDHCIYIGEGDFLCDDREELCMEDWTPILFPIGCDGYEEEI